MPLEVWPRRGLRKSPCIMSETGSPQEKRQFGGHTCPDLAAVDIFDLIHSTAEAMRPLASSLLQQLVIMPPL